MAQLRLEGREAVEAQKIIYLDSDQPDEKLIEYVEKSEPDGSLYRHRWVFAEVGVERVFEQLKIGNGNAEVEAAQEQADQKKPIKKGQIEVTINRIKLGKMSYPKYENYSADLIEEDMTASDLKEVSHTVKREKGKTKLDNMKRFIDWKLYDPDERPYAVFKFHYKSEDMLQKLKLPASKPKARDDEMQESKGKRKAEDEREGDAGDGVAEVTKKVKAIELD